MPSCFIASAAAPVCELLEYGEVGDLDDHADPVGSVRVAEGAANLSAAPMAASAATRMSSSTSAKRACMVATNAS
jgi:hypothetical protein